MQVLIVPTDSRTIEPVVTRGDEERQAFAKRFNQACDRIGIPAKGRGRQKTVAELFGVTQKGARKWLEGESIPATWRIPGMARTFGVGGEWLLTHDDRPSATGGLPVREEPTAYDAQRIESLIQSVPLRDRAHFRWVLMRLLNAPPSGME